MKKRDFEQDYILLEDKAKILISFINEIKTENPFQEEVFKNGSLQKPLWNYRCFIEGDVVEEICKVTQDHFKIAQLISKILQLFHFRVKEKNKKKFKIYISLNKKIIKAEIYLLIRKNKHPWLILYNTQKSITNWLC